MSVELAPRTGLIGVPSSHGLALPPDLTYQIGGRAVSAENLVKSGHEVAPALLATARGVTPRRLPVTQSDRTMPGVPEGYVAPPPVNLGILGVFQGKPVPTPETIARIRAEVRADKSLTPRQRGRLLDAANVPPDRTETGHRVYFAQALHGGPIKIGCSRVPRRRLSDVRSASGIDVRLLGTIPGGFDVEAALQWRFSSFRIAGKHRDKGDWFHPSDALLAYINEHAEFLQADEYVYLRNKRSRRVGR